ncbi:MAG: TIGR01777 family oxidoreductase [Verrucomicrobiota bacterium]
MNDQTIVIPGGSGFLGRTLANFFHQQGARVMILSRTPQTIPHATVLTWDARTLGPWTEALEGATAIINLAGRSVNCRYHAANRKLMMESRTLSTAIIGQVIAQCQSPPQVWLNSSTATIYRHRYDAPNTESTGLYGPEKEAKDHFSLQVAHAWEDAFTEAYQTHKLPQTRGILLRTAMVFGNETGGVYETLRRLTKRGLGGTMGHGRQFVSWIHEDDFCRAIQWLIENPSAEGIYNLTAPNPLTNREMTATMRNVLNVPFGLPATKWMLELGAFFLRTETELILKSRRVLPERLLNEGFTFNYPHFQAALESLESR